MAVFVAAKLNPLQIESILDRLVPLIADKQDHDFFRGVLQIKAENCSSAEFTMFVNKLLKTNV